MVTLADDNLIRRNRWRSGRHDLGDLRTVAVQNGVVETSVESAQSVDRFVASCLRGESWNLDTYSDPSNGSRLLTMTYPNGRTIDYNYYSNTTIDGPLDNAIGRLNSISDGANSGDSGTVLEQYEYLGLATIIARNHPQTGINLTLVGSSGAIGIGGDQYIGLDQFGRIVDQNWINSSGATVDGYTYTYDADGNVTAKNNVLNSAYSEAYTYDNLNRLSGTTRNGSVYQSWNLDSQGNWSSYTNQGSTQTETTNTQNQITSISGSTTPTYDANGDMTQDQNGDTLVYDAWNRLISVKNSSGAVIAQYTYDARGYAVTVTYPQGNSQIPAGTTNYIYYNNQWQVIEVRTDGTASANVTRQMVWSATYVNAAIVQDTFSAGVIQPNERLYFLQDADWNTTAVVGYNSPTQTWGVVQRYIYDSYGNITILNADWSATPAGTQAVVNNLYQGMQYDPITGLYYERARWYSPSLGRWISQDPAQYINGANMYQIEMSDPVDRVDQMGRNLIITGWNGQPLPPPTSLPPTTRPSTTQPGGNSQCDCGAQISAWWSGAWNAAWSAAGNARKNWDEIHDNPPWSGPPERDYGKELASQLAAMGRAALAAFHKYWDTHPYPKCNHSQLPLMPMPLPPFWNPYPGGMQPPIPPVPLPKNWP